MGPQPEDKSALQLLDGLKPLVKADGEVTPEDIAYFVSALDSFLGIPQREHRVIHSGNGYSSVLYGLNEPSVPRLAMCGETVPIWLPRDPVVKYLST